MRNGNTLLGTTVPKSGRVGAGGWVTGGQIANDGTMIVRTDTYNAYVLDPGASTWVKQLQPNVNMDSSLINLFYGDRYPWGSVGTYDVAICKTNSAVRYIACMGRIFVTKNAGALYTQTALPEKSFMFPNEPNRMEGKPLAVDPNNPAVCLFGTPADGVHMTSDYGDTWTKISTLSLPVQPQGQRICIAFDPSSAVTGGKTQGIYVFIPGTGLRRSTNGGSTWSTPAQAPVAPTDAGSMKVSPTGHVFLSGSFAGQNGYIRRFDGTNWLDTGKLAKTVAFANVANRIYCAGAGGGIDVSNDNGATWTLGGDSSFLIDRTAPNIPWHTFTEAAYMSNGDIEFDPTANRIWIAWGIGVWKADNPPTSGGFQTHMSMTEHSVGIENMVTSSMTVSPNGTVGYACHDRGTYIFEKSKVGIVFPEKHGISDFFQHSQVCDYAPEDENFWVASSFLSNHVTGYTADLGKNWTRIDNLRVQSGGPGGGLVQVLSKDVWLQIQTNAVRPLSSNIQKNGLYLTVDRGQNWNLLTIGNNTSVIGMNAYNHSRRVLIKDRYVPGRCYFYNIGEPDDDANPNNQACKGIWRIDVNLDTKVVTSITRVKSSYIVTGGADFYHGKFTQAGPNYFLWTPGGAANGVWRSTDGMATWSEITGTDNLNAGTTFGETYSVGAGKAAAGSVHPTLMVYGYRMNTPTMPQMSHLPQYGLWKSTDNGVTWTRVAQFFRSNFDLPLEIVGDMSEYDRWYIGYGGSGFEMMKYNYQLRAT